MDIAHLRQVLEIMKEFGVDRFKHGDVEVHFAPGHQPTLIEPSAEERRKALHELLKAEENDQDLDELWSSS